MTELLGTIGIYLSSKALNPAALSKPQSYHLDILLAWPILG